MEKYPFVHHHQDGSQPEGGRRDQTEIKMQKSQDSHPVKHETKNSDKRPGTEIENILENTSMLQRDRTALLTAMDMESFYGGAADQHGTNRQKPGSKDGEAVQQHTGEGVEVKASAKSKMSQMATNMKTFLWNPETRQFMGRTSRSWGLILLFYLVFYSFLAGMFSFCMYVMLLTLSPYTPTHRDRVAPPGLMIRPFAKDLKICFDVSNHSSWQHWVRNVEQYLTAYNDSVQESSNIPCTPGQYFLQDDKEESAVKQACQFKRSQLMKCSGLQGEDFGYSVGEPCVFLKMNRIIGYRPGYGSPVAVTCKLYKGEESDLPTMEFYPNPAFDPMYFPYYGKHTHINYTSPLVAVRFSNVKRNHTIFLQCQLNGVGIINDSKQDKFLGRVVFKLRIG